MRKGCPSFFHVDGDALHGVQIDVGADNQAEVHTCMYFVPRSIRYDRDLRVEGNERRVGFRRPEPGGCG